MNRITFHDDGSHTMEVIVAILSSVGGAAKYFNDMGKNKTPFNIAKFILKVGTCVFVGLTAWNAAIGVGFNVNLAIACSNLSAWLGTEALSFAWEMIQNYIRKRLK
jgi:hypothetical protein